MSGTYYTIEKADNENVEVEVTPLFDVHVRDAAVRLRERDHANA